MLVSMRLSLLIGSLVWASCAAQPPSQKGTAARANAVSSDASYQRVLAATDIEGRVVGPPPEGARATVMVFFASWCGPCRHELSLLGELQREDPELRIVGLNAYEDWSDFSDEKRLRRFLADNAPWLQVVRSDAAMMKSFGGVPKVPTLFVFDRAGRMVHSFRRNRRAPPSKSELASAVTLAKAQR